MDIACLGAALVSRMRNVISKASVASVDVVGGLWGCALQERLRGRQDGATRLMDGRKDET